MYAFSLAKLYQSGNEIHIIDYIEIFNSNTFSTFISMVICMAYKFFTTDENKQELDSGLSRKWIWLTILATIIYGMCAVINASRYCLITSVIMAAASLAYIILFFKVMRKKKFDYSSLWILIEVIIMLSKVCEVFTKEYRKETAYQEFTAKMIQYFKLNNNSESVEDKVERLK